MREKQPQCSATVFGPRVHNWSCNRRGVVQREGQWFCKQHDPKAVKARQSTREGQRKDHEREQAEILDECRRAAAELGAGEPYWFTALRGGYHASGYRRFLTITLEEARDLAATIRKLQK